MKNKITSIIFTIVFLVTVFFAFFNYYQSVEAKKEVGSLWNKIVNNSNDTIDFMRLINLNEVAKTEEGREFLKRVHGNLLYQLESNFPEASDVIMEIENILIKSIENGEVSEDDIKTYIRNLGVIDTIIYDLNQELETDMDWYKSYDSNSFGKSIVESSK